MIFSVNKIIIQSFIQRYITKPKNILTIDNFLLNNSKMFSNFLPNKKIYNITDCNLSYQKMLEYHYECNKKIIPHYLTSDEFLKTKNTYNINIYFFDYVKNINQKTNKEIELKLIHNISKILSIKHNKIIFCFTLFLENQNLINEFQIKNDIKLLNIHNKIFKCVYSNNYQILNNFYCSNDNVEPKENLFCYAIKRKL